MDQKKKSQIEKPDISRVGIRSFFGHPEKLIFTPYGIFMACIPILLVALLIWYFW